MKFGSHWLTIDSTSIIVLGPFLHDALLYVIIGVLPEDNANDSLKGVVPMDMWKAVSYYNPHLPSPLPPKPRRNSFNQDDSVSDINTT